jgi:hypothetical protein
VRPSCFAREFDLTWWKKYVESVDRGRVIYQRAIAWGGSGEIVSGSRARSWRTATCSPGIMVGVRAAGDAGVGERARIEWSRG